MWNEQDWDFFLEDILSHLKPGGLLFLSLNRFNDRNYIPPSVHQLWLEKYSAVVEISILSREVSIRKVPLIPLKGHP